MSECDDTDMCQIWWQNFGPPADLAAAYKPQSEAETPLMLSHAATAERRGDGFVASVG